MQGDDLIDDVAERVRTFPPTPDWRRRRERRARVAVDPLAHEGLLLLLANLRAANAETLFDLFFGCRGTKWRTAMRRLHDLVEAGYLAHLRLDNARCVYHLTEKACALTPNLELRAHSALYTRPRDRQAMYCWLRSKIFAKLIDAGYHVGNDPPALYALRRFLIDHIEAALKRSASSDGNWLLESKLEMLRRGDTLDVSRQELLFGYRTKCRECGAERVLAEHWNPETKARCDGRLRAASASVLDIAWKKIDGRYQAMVVFIDNPTLSLEAQLEMLRIVTPGVPVLPVIVRSTDPRSRFDVTRSEWIEFGPRHAQLNKAFAQQCGMFGGEIDIVDPWPTLQAYPVRDPHTKSVKARGARPTKKKSAKGARPHVREVAHEREHDHERKHDHEHRERNEPARVERAADHAEERAASFVARRAR